MTFPGPASAAAQSRVLRLRRRPDLATSAQELAGGRVWVLKDPVALRYYHLAEEEYLVLSMLDGRTTAEQITAAFAARFAPRRLEPAALKAFLYRLHQEGLVLSEAYDQGVELSRREGRRRRQARLSRWTELLALRFRGVDPDPLLRRLDGWCGWLFSRRFAAVAAVAAVVAVLLTATRYEEFRARLPGLVGMFTAERLFWLAVALAGVKVLHELGHGLACRRFGGECHELGLMLLVFTPCLYCDVSDAWMVSSRWKRMAISAAGIYVEGILTVVCALVWWSAPSGSLQLLCFSVMTVCSVNTLLVNGNPLLRYDGYYVFSDLLQVPNLAEQSQGLLWQGLAKGCLGIDLFAPGQLTRRRRALLMLYAAASLAYRLLLVAVVLWVLHVVLRRWGLAAVAWIVAAVVVGKMFAIPSVGAVLAIAARRRELRGKRMLGSGLVAAAVLAGLLVPWPHRLSAPAVFAPRDAQPAYVTVAGRLASGISEGTPVRRGEPLARLENLDLELTLCRLQGESKRLGWRLRYLEAHRANAPALGAQIPATRASLAELDEQIAHRRREYEQLVLKAPCDGKVLPPPRRAGTPRRAADASTRIDQVELGQRDLGASMAIGTLYCRVGNPGRLEAVLRIEQDQVDQVRPGQTVYLRPEERPDQLVDGVIEEIGKVDLGRPLAPVAEAAEAPPPAGPAMQSAVYYEARVRLDRPHPELLIASTAHARIAVTPQSLLTRAYRFLCRLLHF